MVCKHHVLVTHSSASPRSGHSRLCLLHLCFKDGAFLVASQDRRGKRALGSLFQGTSTIVRLTPHDLSPPKGSTSGYPALGTGFTVNSGGW